MCREDWRPLLRSRKSHTTTDTGVQAGRPRVHQGPSVSSDAFLQPRCWASRLFSISERGCSRSGLGQAHQRVSSRLHLLAEHRGGGLLHIYVCWEPKLQPLRPSSHMSGWPQAETFSQASGSRAQFTGQHRGSVKQSLLVVARIVLRAEKRGLDIGAYSGVQGTVRGLLDQRATPIRCRKTQSVKKVVKCTPSPCNAVHQALETRRWATSAPVAKEPPGSQFGWRSRVKIFSTCILTYHVSTCKAYMYSEVYTDMLLARGVVKN